MKATAGQTHILRNYRGIFACDSYLPTSFLDQNGELTETYMERHRKNTPLGH
jgi:hypothetical protein